jgi:acyl dehydratase
MVDRLDQQTGTPAGRAIPPTSLQFADLHPGRVIEAGLYEVSEAEVLQFAAAYDPQWFHTDARAASEGHFGGLIASGWHTCSMAMRLVVESVLKDAETLASPGVAYIKWPHPVRPGDRVNLRFTVLEARIARSRPTLGVLRSRWQLLNQQGVEVLDMESTTLFNLAKR